MKQGLNAVDIDRKLVILIIYPRFNNTSIELEIPDDLVLL